jgi:hypothetical protein
MLSVVVVMLNVIILSVVVPNTWACSTTHIAPTIINKIVIKLEHEQSNYFLCVSDKMSTTREH